MIKQEATKKCKQNIPIIESFKKVDYHPKINTIDNSYTPIKKGYVLGIGAANFDICANAKNKIRLYDSNPGLITTSVGGVTRNICENLAKLGSNVKLITAFGDDYFSQIIKESCDKANIDYSYSKLVENYGSSSYVSIIDDLGDMYVATSDMHILQKIDIPHLKENASVIKKASCISCDACLPYETIEYLLKTYSKKIPIFIDPVSCTYAEKIKPLIGYFDTVKPNLVELEILSDMTIKTDEDLTIAAKKLIKQGVKHLFVSLGDKGCFYMDYHYKTIKKALRPMDIMVNATGGGDAFMAAIIHGFMYNYSTSQKIDFALAAGLAGIMANETINPHMSIELLETILKEYKS